MKKKSLNSFKKLNLNKKSISNFNVLGGVAATCQGPCQGGTSCCNPSGGGEEGDGGSIKLPVTSFRTILSCKFCPWLHESEFRLAFFHDWVMFFQFDPCKVLIIIF